MKQLIFAISISVIMFSSCKKESESKMEEHVKSPYTVLAIGQDTARTPFMWARSEALPVLIAEDTYLRIELLGYTNGQYVLQVKNKQKCEADFQLSYTDITVSAISPNRKNSLYYDQVKANRTETFYITGSKHIGKIKVKALTICEWSCDPEWLSVDITAAILPITYLSYSSETHDGFVTLNWAIENPQETDKYVVLKQVGDALVTVWTQTSDKTTKNHSINIWDVKE